MARIVDDALARLEPLETAMNRAWWDAAVSGDPAAYDRLEDFRNRVDALLADEDLFRRLETLRNDPSGEPVRDRVVELLWLEALPRQMSSDLLERINAFSTRIERDFATYRPVVDGRARSTNDLERTLVEVTNEERLRTAWEALKSVGPRVAERLLELVRLRNRGAREIGYGNYRELRLALYEQEPATVDAFFDRLDRVTAGPFAGVKSVIDARLAERLDVDHDRLRPWHVGDPFFQQAPSVFGADLDAVYKKTDPLALARRTFDGIGFDIEPILARSSLYEADGKDPHAFATDIDREGDVRILLNLRPNERWVGTTLHELGHAIYDVGIDRSLPWMLRRPAHTLTTEAIAMLFGRLSQDAGWMHALGVVDDDDGVVDAARRQTHARMLVFARWTQVMTRFEKALYADPDGDLQDVWWSLVERYQGLARPERPGGAADWAAKIHVVAAPVYYHNYMLGECFASQIQARLRAATGSSSPLVNGGERVGAWLGERIFSPGARLHYDTLAREATGAPVGPDAFAAEFIDAA